MIVVERHANGAPREVDLNPSERAASRYFEQCLDQGADVETAIGACRNVWTLTPDFIAWLRR